MKNTTALQTAVNVVRARPVIGASSSAVMTGLGVAVPESSWSQHEAQEQMAGLWGLTGAALQRWRRIIAGSGIDTRHAVLPVRETIDQTTAQRMAEYERFAPELAANAARVALRSAAVPPESITDLVVVSCTGFAAPGVDAALVNLLELNSMVRRTIVGFQGCYGGIIGLRTAAAACCAKPPAAALLVCVELCSLHMRRESSAENQVASALFADGAAAAVIQSPPVTCAAVHAEIPSEEWRSRTAAIADPRRGRHGSHCHSHTASTRSESIDRHLLVKPLRITSGSSLLIPEGANWMTWRITDCGFAMTLSREVPAALRQRLPDFVQNASGGLGQAMPSTFVVHPGGPGILDAVNDALGLGGNVGLQAARSVLRRFGNMSSATVLFVLDEALRLACEEPFMLLSFGPGLTVEALILLSVSGFDEVR
jgi:alkylresorcinol/alkylpyrone synthase